MVRRGERPLRRHLGAVTKSSRGRGCLRTDLEAFGRTPQQWSKEAIALRKLTTGADLTISVR